MPDPLVIDVMFARKRLREAEFVAVHATRRRDAIAHAIASGRVRAEDRRVATSEYESLATVADEAWLFWQVAHAALEEAEAVAARS